jgi:hypothetical protein
MAVMPKVEMAPTCADVSATICAVLNAAQSSVVKAEIVFVDSPAICAVDRAVMIVAMGFSLFGVQ